MKQLLASATIVLLALSLSGCNDSVVINCDYHAFGQNEPGCGILIWLK